MAILSENEIKILNKIGDAFIPENNGFPKFSDTGCVYHADSMLEYMDPEDLEDLKLLFFAGKILPKFMLRGLVRFTNLAPYLPNFIAKELRFINFGIRSLIYTLYYSSKTSPEFNGNTVFDVIDFHVSCKEDDE